MEGIAETTSISTADIRVSDFESENSDRWEVIEKKVDRIKAPVNRAIANNIALILPYKANKLSETVQDISKGGGIVKAKVKYYEKTRGDKSSSISFTMPLQESYEPQFGPKIAKTYATVLKYGEAEKTLEPEFLEKNFVKRIGGTARDYTELEDRFKFLTYASYEIKGLIKKKGKNGKEKVVKYLEVGHLIDGFKKADGVYKVRLNPDRNPQILAISKGEKPTNYLRLEGVASRENAINFYLSTKKGLKNVFPISVRFILFSMVGIDKNELKYRSIIYLAEVLDKALLQVKGWEWKIDTGKLELSNSMKLILSNTLKTGSGWSRLLKFLKEDKTAEIGSLSKKDFLKLKIDFKFKGILK